MSAVPFRPIIENYPAWADDSYWREVKAEQPPSLMDAYWEEARKQG